MEFKVKKFVMESLLSKASSVLATKDIMPILKNFNITVDSGSLRAVATDLELSVIAHTELVESVESGRAVFPGKKLVDIVKESEDGIMTIKVNDDVAIITCAGATWSIQLMNAEDYPEIPEVSAAESIATNRLVFMNALNTVKGAAAKESVRPALQMIDVEAGNIRASDGAIFRQIHVKELEDVEMQIPLGAVEDLTKMLRNTEAENIEIGQTEDHLLFIVGTDVFIVTKNNVDYPDVENMLVIPAKKNKHQLTIDRAQLIAGIKRVRVTADEDTKGLVLSLTDNVLTLRARDKYGNWSTQIIDVHWSSAARDLGVNHENMLDAVSSVDSPSLAIMLGDDTKTRKAPIFIEDGDIIAVLQQLKVDLN